MRNNDTVIQIRIAHETKEKWEKYARKHDLTLSELIRRAVETLVVTSDG